MRARSPSPTVVPPINERSPQDRSPESSDAHNNDQSSLGDLRTARPPVWHEDMKYSAGAKRRHSDLSNFNQASAPHSPPRTAEEISLAPSTAQRPIVDQEENVSMTAGEVSAETVAETAEPDLEMAERRERLVAAVMEEHRLRPGEADSNFLVKSDLALVNGDLAERVDTSGNNHDRRRRVADGGGSKRS